MQPQQCQNGKSVSTRLKKPSTFCFRCSWSKSKNPTEVPKRQSRPCREWFDATRPRRGFGQLQKRSWYFIRTSWMQAEHWTPELFEQFFQETLQSDEVKGDDIPCTGSTPLNKIWNVHGRCAREPLEFWQNNQGRRHVKRGRGVEAEVRTELTVKSSLATLCGTSRTLTALQLMMLQTKRKSWSHHPNHEKTTLQWVVQSTKISGKDHDEVRDREIRVVTLWWEATAHGKREKRDGHHLRSRDDTPNDRFSDRDTFSNAWRIRVSSSSSCSPGGKFRHRTRERMTWVGELKR